MRLRLMLPPVGIVASFFVLSGCQVDPYETLADMGKESKQVKEQQTNDYFIVDPDNGKTYVNMDTVRVE